jgi:pimeloyl-ACP methyl ester carboxylesterase
MTTSTLDLPAGRIAYADRGSGPTVVFVHGLLVDGSLWSPVADALSADHRCIVPELPLGSHREAMNGDADLSPPGLAAIVAGVLDALELEDVTLVGNDTGGAISQLVATRHPERLGRLVLTPCDAYENFLPPAFRPLQVMARVPGGMNMIAQPMRLGAIRRLPLAYGWLAKHGVTDELTRRWVNPALTSRAIRRDATKVLRGISKRYTLEAAERLAHFDRPALIAWAPEDKFFKLKCGRQLADAIPNARLETVPDSYTFMPLDQPQRLANLVRDFVRDGEPATLPESG